MSFMDLGYSFNKENIDKLKGFFLPQIKIGNELFSPNVNAKTKNGVTKATLNVMSNELLDEINAGKYPYYINNTFKTFTINYFQVTPESLKTLATFLKKSNIGEFIINGNQSICCPSKSKIESTLKEQGVCFTDVSTISSPSSNTITKIVIKAKYKVEALTSSQQKNKSLDEYCKLQRSNDKYFHDREVAKTFLKTFYTDTEPDSIDRVTVCIRKIIYACFPICPKETKAVLFSEFCKMLISNNGDIDKVYAFGEEFFKYFKDTRVWYESLQYMIEENKVDNKTTLENKCEAFNPSVTKEMYIKLFKWLETLDQSDYIQVNLEHYKNKIQQL